MRTCGATLAGDFRRYAVIGADRQLLKLAEEHKCPCSVSENTQNGSRLYSRIPAPVLAIFRIDTDWNTPICSSLHPWTPAQHVQEFEKGVPTARVVRILNASHVIWELNEAQVLSEMRVFIGTLSRSEARSSAVCLREEV
jgi:hypothetical protein